MSMGRDERGGPGDDAERRLGGQLRHVRGQQGWSLHDIEVASAGRFKASVLGAYERGERTISLDRLRQLAEFYRIPVTELLPHDPPAPPPEPSPRSVVIDLVALERHRGDEPVLARYVDAVRARRGDPSTGMLTIRERDLAGIAAAEGVSPDDLAEDLRTHGVLR